MTERQRVDKRVVGRRPDTVELLPIEEYDRIVVSFSGGKDSTACVLHLLDRGVKPDQMVLWHNLVDGAPGSEPFMDWPVTEAYSRAFAQAFGIEILFSWREGGFEREMLREGTPTAPVVFETPHGISRTGGRGPAVTRLKFPQPGAALKTRWCSAYLKIDVARRVFSRDPQYSTGKFLLVTGERREESPARAKLASVEKHASNTASRRVDQWRAIAEWPEAHVWAIMQRHRVRPHPAYYLGWSRVSCMLCIFGDPNQWASALELAPKAFAKVAEYEHRFGVTVHRDRTVLDSAVRGKSFLPADEDLRKLAMGTDYPMELIRVPEHEEWKQPAGAYRRGGGPT